MIATYTATLELADDDYSLEIAEEDNLTMTMGMAVEVTMVGGTFEEVTVTPTTEEQVITADTGYDALSSVTVEAIPSNYGLITWNGSTLTVS